MWSKITGKSSDASSHDSRRKEHGSSSSRRRAESIVSSSTARNPPSRVEDRSDYPPTLSSRSNSYAQPAPSVSSIGSYATARDYDQKSERTAPSRSGFDDDDYRSVRSDRRRDDDLRSTRSERHRDEDLRSERSERRRDRSSSRDRKRDRKDGDREHRRKDKRDSKDSKDKRDKEKEESGKKSKTRPKSGRRLSEIVDEPVLPRAADITGHSSGAYDLPMSSPAVSQYTTAPYGESTTVPASPGYGRMDAHVASQFPGQNPTDFSYPYRPPPNSQQGGSGLASDYYGDQGQSVQYQPGVRPDPPSVIAGTEPHLISPSAVPNPPTETGQGAAAQYYGPPSTNGDRPPVKPPRPLSMPGSFEEEPPAKPPRPNSMHGKMSTAAAAAVGGAALGYGLGHDSSSSHHGSSSHHSTSIHQSSSSTTFYQQGSNHHVGDSQYYTPSTVGTSTQMYADSEPGLPAYAQSTATSKPSKSGKHSSNSNAGLYAAGAAGLAAGAYGLHEHHAHQHQHQHSSLPPNGNHYPAQIPAYSDLGMAMRQKQRGPVDKIVDWWKDYEDVRKMEEYTEYIGVCRHCFDPTEPPTMAPRKHHYHAHPHSHSHPHRRSSGSIRHSRVDKGSRYGYSSSDDEHKSKSHSWVAKGLAGYGIAKVGKALWWQNQDFDDTYSAKSGRRHRSSRSSLSARSRSGSRDRRSVTSRGVVRHRSRSRDSRVSRSYTTDRKEYKVVHRHSESRSRSRDRKSGLFSAAAGAALGASVAGAAARRRSRSHSRSPPPGYVIRKHHTEEPSGSASFFGLGEKDQRHSTRHSVISSASRYDDTKSHRSAKENTGSVFGGMFSSTPITPTKRQKAHAKKKKGFFNFGNSSTSSTSSVESGLMYGGSTLSRRSSTLSRRSSGRKKRRNSDEKLNATLIGLGATAAALAAANGRDKHRSKRKSDLASVRSGGKHHGARHSSDRTRMPGSYVGSGSDEEGWESASEDESDTSSIDSGLAFGDFGPKSRKSIESLRSNASGTDKWSWRWGSKKDAKKHKSQDSLRAGAGLAGVGIGAGLAGAAAADGRSSASSVPTPLQTVDPVATSDPNSFDAIRRTASVTSQQQGQYGQPLVTARPGPVPLQQPQPIVPVSNAPVYTSQAAWAPTTTYTAPSGPPVFSGGASSKAPTTSFPGHPGHSEYAERPPMSPRRSSSPTHSSSTKRDLAIAGAAAAATAGVIAAAHHGRSSSTSRRRASSPSTRVDSPKTVGFDLTRAQMEKEDREMEKEREREHEREIERDIERERERQRERERDLERERERELEREREREYLRLRRIEEETRLQERRLQEQAEREAAARREAEAAEARERARQQAQEKADLDRETERILRERAEAAEAAAAREVAARQEMERRRLEHEAATRERERLEREIYEADLNRKREEEEEALRKREREREEKIDYDIESRHRELRARERDVVEPEEHSWTKPAVAAAAGIAAGAAVAGIAHDKDRDEKRSSKIDFDDDHLYEEEIMDPDYFRKKDKDTSGGTARESSRERQEEIARNAAKKVMADIEERWRGPTNKQEMEDFWAPPELRDRSPSSRVSHSPDADVEVRHSPYVVVQPPYEPQYNFTATRHGDDHKDARYHSVPTLNLIEPTPPVSIAGSIRGEHSGPSSPNVETKKDVDEAIKEAKKEKEKEEKQRKRTSVTWGEDETYHYEAQTPESFREHYISQQDMNRHLPEDWVLHGDQAYADQHRHDEIVVEAESPRSGTERTTYRPDIHDHIRGWGPDTESPVEEIKRFVDDGRPVIESTSPEHTPTVITPGDEKYQTPFFETVPGFAAYDVSPGAEAGPGQHGFVEEIVDEPVEEIIASKPKEAEPHMPGGWDDEEPLKEAETSSWTEPKLSKKEQRKRDKAAKRASTDTQEDLTSSTGSVKDLDRDSRVESESKIDEGGWDAPLSKKDKKKRDKAAKRASSSREDSPSVPSTPAEEPKAEEIWEDVSTSKKDKKKKKKRDSVDRDPRDIEPSYSYPPTTDESRDAKSDVGITPTRMPEVPEDMSRRRSLDAGHQPSSAAPFSFATAAGIVAGGLADSKRKESEPDNLWAATTPSQQMPRAPSPPSGPVPYPTTSNGDHASTAQHPVDSPARSIPSTAFHDYDELADAKQPSKKGKRRSRVGSSAGSPLRSEVAFDDYVGMDAAAAAAAATAAAAKDLSKISSESFEAANVPLPKDDSPPWSPTGDKSSRQKHYIYDEPEEFPIEAGVSLPHDPYGSPAAQEEYPERGYAWEDEGERKKHRHHHRHRSEDPDTRSVASDDRDSEGRRKHRHHRRRESERSDGTYDETRSTVSEGRYDEEGHRKHKHRKHRSTGDDDSRSVVSEFRDDEDDERRKHKHRRSKRESDLFDDSIRDRDARSDPGDVLDRDDPERRRHKRRSKREGEFDDEASVVSSPAKYGDDDKKKDKEKKGLFSSIFGKSKESLPETSSTRSHERARDDNDVDDHKHRRRKHRSSTHGSLYGSDDDSRSVVSSTSGRRDKRLSGSRDDSGMEYSRHYKDDIITDASTRSSDKRNTFHGAESFLGLRARGESERLPPLPTVHVPIAAAHFEHQDELEHAMPMFTPLPRSRSTSPTEEAVAATAGHTAADDNVISFPKVRPGSPDAAATPQPLSSRKRTPSLQSMRQTSATAVPLHFRGFGSRPGSEVGSPASSRPISTTAVPIPFLSHQGRRASTGGQGATSAPRSPVSPQNAGPTAPATDPLGTLATPPMLQQPSQQQHKHKRLPSTEFKSGGTFRPLYLVERNASRRGSRGKEGELQVEDLPTLPSSRSPSVSQESGEEWASAVEDVDDGEGDTSFFGGEAPPSESSVGASGYASATEGEDDGTATAAQRSPLPDWRHTGLRIDTGASRAVGDDVLGSQQSTPRAWEYVAKGGDDDVFDVPAAAAQRLEAEQALAAAEEEKAHEGKNSDSLAAAAAVVGGAAAAGLIAHELLKERREDEKKKDAEAEEHAQETREEVVLPTAVEEPETVGGEEPVTAIEGHPPFPSAVAAEPRSIEPEAPLELSDAAGRAPGDEPKLEGLDQEPPTSSVAAEKPSTSREIVEPASIDDHTTSTTTEPATAAEEPVFTTVAAPLPEPTVEEQPTSNILDDFMAGEPDDAAIEEARAAAEADRERQELESDQPSSSTSATTRPALLTRTSSKKGKKGKKAAKLGTISPEDDGGDAAAQLSPEQVREARKRDTEDAVDAWFTDDNGAPTTAVASEAEPTPAAEKVDESEKSGVQTPVAEVPSALLSRKGSKKKAKKGKKGKSGSVSEVVSEPPTDAAAVGPEEPLPSAAEDVKDVRPEDVPLPEAGQAEGLETPLEPENVAQTEKPPLAVVEEPEKGAERVEPEAPKVLVDEQVSSMEKGSGIADAEAEQAPALVKDNVAQQPLPVKEAVVREATPVQEPVVQDLTTVEDPGVLEHQQPQQPPESLEQTTTPATVPDTVTGEEAAPAVAGDVTAQEEPPVATAAPVQEEVDPEAEFAPVLSRSSSKKKKKKAKKGSSAGGSVSGSGVATPVVEEKPLQEQEQVQAPVEEPPAVVEETPIPTEDHPAVVGVEEAQRDIGVGEEKVDELPVVEETAPMTIPAAVEEVDPDDEFAPVESASSKKKKKKKGKKSGSGSAGLVTPVEAELLVEEAVDQPAIEEPVVKEPVVEEQVSEQPVVETPAFEEPVVQEAVVETPIHVEPITEEPQPATAVTQEPELTVPEPASESREIPAETTPAGEVSTPFPGSDPEAEFAPVVSSKKKKKKGKKSSSGSGFATPIEDPAPATLSVEEVKPSEPVKEEPQQTVPEPALDEPGPAIELAPSEEKPVSAGEEIPAVPVVDERGVQEVLEEGTAAVQPAEPEVAQPSSSTDLQEQTVPSAEQQQAVPADVVEAEPEAEFAPVLSRSSSKKKKKKGKKGSKSVSESPAEAVATPVEEVVQEPAAIPEPELAKSLELSVSEEPVSAAPVEVDLEHSSSKDLPQDVIAETAATADQEQALPAASVPLPDADNDQELAEPKTEEQPAITEKTDILEHVPPSEQMVIPSQVEEVPLEAGPKTEISAVPLTKQAQEEEIVPSPEESAAQVIVEEVQEKQPHHFFGTDVPLQKAHDEDAQIPLAEDEREEFKEAERAMEVEPVVQEVQEEQPAKILGADVPLPETADENLAEQLTLPGDERQELPEAESAVEAGLVVEHAQENQLHDYNKPERAVETETAVEEVQEKEPHHFFGVNIPLPEGDDRELAEQLSIPEDELQEFNEAERAMEIEPGVTEEPMVEKVPEVVLPTAGSLENTAVPENLHEPKPSDEVRVPGESPTQPEDAATSATFEASREAAPSETAEAPEAPAEGPAFDGPPAPHHESESIPVVSETQPELAVSDVASVSESHTEIQPSTDPLVVPQDSEQATIIHETQPEEECSVKPSKKKKGKKNKKAKASGQSSVDITEPPTPAERDVPELAHDTGAMEQFGTSEQPAEIIQAAGEPGDLPEMGTTAATVADAETERGTVDLEHEVSHDLGHSSTQGPELAEGPTSVLPSSTFEEVEQNEAFQEPVSTVQPTIAEEAAKFPLPSDIEEPSFASEVPVTPAVEQVHDKAIEEPQQTLEPELAKEAPAEETPTLGQESSAAIEAQPDDEWSTPAKSKKKDKKKKKKRGSVAQTPIESSAPGSPKLEATPAEEFSTVTSQTQGEPAVTVDQLQPSVENVEAASEITPVASGEPASVADDLRGPATPAASMPIDPAAPVSEENLSNPLADESRDKTPLYAGEWKLPTHSKENDKEGDERGAAPTGQEPAEGEAVPTDEQISSTATPLLETTESVPRDANAWTEDPTAPSAHQPQPVSLLQPEIADEPPKGIEFGAEQQVEAPLQVAEPLVEEPADSPAVPETTAEEEWAFMPAKKNKKGKKGKKQGSISSTPKEVEQVPEPVAEPIEDVRAVESTALESAPAEPTGENLTAPSSEPAAPVEAGEDEWALPAKKKKGKKGKKGFADIVQEAVQPEEVPVAPEKDLPEQAGDRDDKVEETAPASLEDNNNIPTEVAQENTSAEAPLEPSIPVTEAPASQELPGEEQSSNIKPISDVFTEKPTEVETAPEQPKEADAEDIWAVPTRKASKKKKKKGKQASLEESATPPTAEPVAEPSVIENVFEAPPVEEPKEILEAEDAPPEVVSESFQPEVSPEVPPAVEKPKEIGEVDAEDEWAPAPTSSKKKKKKAKKGKQGSVSEALPTLDDAPPTVEEKVEEQPAEDQSVEVVPSEQPRAVAEPVLEEPIEAAVEQVSDSKDVDLVPSEQPQHLTQEPVAEAVEEQIPESKDIKPQPDVEPVMEDITDKGLVEEPLDKPAVEEQPAKAPVVEQPVEASIEQNLVQQTSPSEPAVTEVANVQTPQEAGEDEWDLPIKKKKKGKKGKRDSTPSTPPVVDEPATVVEEPTVPLDTASPIVEEPTHVAEQTAPITEESVPITADTQNDEVHLTEEPKTFGDELKDIPTSVELLNQEPSLPIEAEAQQEADKALPAAEPATKDEPSTQEIEAVQETPQEAQPEDVWAVPTRKKSKKGKKGKQQNVSTPPAELSQAQLEPEIVKESQPESEAISEPQPVPEAVSESQPEDKPKEPQESTPIEAVPDEEFSIPLSKKDKKKQKKKKAAATAAAAAAAASVDDSPEVQTSSPLDDAVTQEVPREEDVPKVEHDTEPTVPPLSFADAANIMAAGLSDSKPEEPEPESSTAQPEPSAEAKHEGAEEVKDRALENDKTLTEESALPHTTEKITSEDVARDVALPETGTRDSLDFEPPKEDKVPVSTEPTTTWLDGEDKKPSFKAPSFGFAAAAGILADIVADSRREEQAPEPLKSTEPALEDAPGVPETPSITIVPSTAPPDVAQEIPEGPSAVLEDMEAPKEPPTEQLEANAPAEDVVGPPLETSRDVDAATLEPASALVEVDPPEEFAPVKKSKKKKKKGSKSSGAETPVVEEPVPEQPIIESKELPAEPSAETEIVPVAEAAAADIKPAESEPSTLDQAKEVAESVSGAEEKRSGSPVRDVDFAATLAAGLQDSGFDPSLVLDDPTFHERKTPPGSALEADSDVEFTSIKPKKNKKKKKALATQDIEGDQETKEVITPASPSQEPMAEDAPSHDPAFAAAMASVLDDPTFNRRTPSPDSAKEAVSDEFFPFQKRPKKKKGKKSQDASPEPELADKSQFEITEQPTPVSDVPRDEAGRMVPEVLPEAAIEEHRSVTEQSPGEVEHPKDIVEEPQPPPADEQSREPVVESPAVEAPTDVPTAVENPAPETGSVVVEAKGDRPSLDAAPAERSVSPDVAVQNEWALPIRKRSKKGKKAAGNESGEQTPIEQTTTSASTAPVSTAWADQMEEETPIEIPAQAGSLVQMLEKQHEEPTAERGMELNQEWDFPWNRKNDQAKRMSVQEMVDRAEWQMNEKAVDMEGEQRLQEPTHVRAFEESPIALSELSTKQEPVEQEVPSPADSQGSRIANLFPGLERVKRKVPPPRPAESSPTDSLEKRGSRSSLVSERGSFERLRRSSPLHSKRSIEREKGTEPHRRLGGLGHVMQQPTWEFPADLPNRDSAVNMNDTPILHSEPTFRSLVRDSGFHEGDHTPIEDEQQVSPPAPMRVDVETGPEWETSVRQGESTENIPMEDANNQEAPPTVTPVERTSPPFPDSNAAQGSVLDTPLKQPDTPGEPMSIASSPPSAARELPQEPRESLFGDPTQQTPEKPQPSTTPSRHLKSSSISLEPIREHSPEDSAVHKQGRPISDVGMPDHGVKSLRRSLGSGKSLRDEMQSSPGHPDEDQATANSRNASFVVRERAGSIGDPFVEKQRPSSVVSDRSIGSHAGSIFARIKTPEQMRSPSSISARSETPPLRRVDRVVSGDLRSASQLAEAKARARSPATSATITSPTRAGPSTYDRVRDKGKGRALDMSQSYEGWGDAPGTPLSPTRPPSVRKRQSMHIMDLETRLDQLSSENRLLQEAKARAEEAMQDANVNQDRQVAEAVESRDAQIRAKDAEIAQISEILHNLRQEIARLNEVNAALSDANRNLTNDTNQRYATLQAETQSHERRWQEAERALEQLRVQHSTLSAGMEDVVRQEIKNAMKDRDAEINRLHEELADATEQVKTLQRQVLETKQGDSFLTVRDEDYFDTACQQLCQHVQQWVLRFSKFSDNRACRLSTDVKDEKIETRLDNAILDGTDVDMLLADRVRRRDVFMSVVMTMIWEYVFTRYLFGMDREQRQKLKALEKTLTEVGPPRAVAQWRAITLTLLSQRAHFERQRAQDTEAVVQEIFGTLASLLPPPSHLADKIQESLRNVLRLAVNLSIEMRTQRAEYIMLPPLQPEYDTNGDLVRKVYFNAALMNERSGETSSNEELEQLRAVVKIVLFPLVVKKGDDLGEGDDEIVVCPAQVLTAKTVKDRKVVRVLSGAMEMGDDPRSVRSRSSLSRVPGASPGLPEGSAMDTAF
ncbi:Titin [Lasiodiplodia hormozganensis]|uniref:Titin n=1 Tax=Lasiodiplodia hormozganensis TaxID=869390 RepID=A0AA40C5T0_9PEZI|nr:Titin [Lasiodiplodia hormozganensis]